MESREEGVTALLAVDAGLLRVAAVGASWTLEASADASGARIELAGRTVVEIESGLDDERLLTRMAPC